MTPPHIDVATWVRQTPSVRHRNLHPEKARHEPRPTCRRTAAARTVPPKRDRTDRSDLRRGAPRGRLCCALPLRRGPVPSAPYDQPGRPDPGQRRRPPPRGPGIRDIRVLPLGTGRSSADSDQDDGLRVPRSTKSADILGSTTRPSPDRACRGSTPRYCLARLRVSGWAWPCLSWTLWPPRRPCVTEPHGPPAPGDRLPREGLRELSRHLNPRPPRRHLPGWRERHVRRLAHSHRSRVLALRPPDHLELLPGTRVGQPRPTLHRPASASPVRRPQPRRLNYAPLATRGLNAPGACVTVPWDPVRTAPAVRPRASKKKKKKNVNLFRHRLP